MVKYIIGITLSILLLGCMGNEPVSVDDAKGLLAEKKATGKTVVTPLVRQFLLDPEISRLVFVKNESQLQLDLLLADLEPMVTASSSAGAIAGDDNELSGSVQVNLSKDADLNNLFVVKKDIIKNDGAINNIQLMQAINVKLHVIFDALNMHTTSSRKLEIIRQGLDEYSSVKSLIDTTRQIGAMSKGQYLKIQSQLNDIEMNRELLQLQKDSAEVTLDIELGENFKRFMPGFKDGLTRINQASLDNSFDESILALNKAIVANIDNNIVIEKKSKLWNGAYRASLSSVLGDDVGGFLGINLTKPLYDAGRSEGRIAVLQNKKLQAETETKTVKKTVSLAFGSMQAGEKINKAQITLVNEKLANLLEIRDDLKVRQNSGKAQLEEVAQNTLDIANAKIQAISLDSVLLKSKLDYVLLQQRAYEYILTENEIAQIKK